MAFTENQLKGNWGESHVTALLEGRGCIVRPVTQGRDSGIDLYCETTFRDEPDLHFWVQVKTSQDYNEKRDQYSFAPDKQSHIKYWLSQPIPVFIFLVPDLRDEIDVPFYICSALNFEAKHRTETFLKVIPSQRQLESFLEDALPYFTYRWYLKEGIVAPLNRGPRSGYTRIFPAGLAQDHERGFYVNLRRSLWRLSGDILMAGEYGEEAFAQAKPYLATFAVLNEEKPDLEHHETFYMLGLLAEAETDYEAAEEYYQIAITSIQGDVTLKDPSKTSANQMQMWDQVVAGLEHDLARAQNLAKENGPNANLLRPYSFLYRPIRKPLHLN